MTIPWIPPFSPTWVVVANVATRTAPVPVVDVTPTVGIDVYPAPALVRATPVMEPAKAVVAVAPVPVLPVLSVMVTVGADVYPVPTLVIVIPVTAPAVTVTVPVAVLPPVPLGGEKVTVGLV